MCRRPAVSTMQHVHAAADCGIGGVERHGRRVAALLALDHFHAESLGPDFQLLDGGGAERVARRQQHALVLIAQVLGDLGDAGGLARAVDARHEDDRRPVPGSAK